MVYESNEALSNKAMKIFHERLAKMIILIIKKFREATETIIPPFMSISLYTITNSEFLQWSRIFDALNNSPKYRKLFRRKLIDITNGEFDCSFSKALKSDIYDTVFPEQLKNHQNKSTMWVIHILGNCIE